MYNTACKMTTLLHFSAFKKTTVKNVLNFGCHYKAIPQFTDYEL
jgi:hypothetical protein